MKRLLFPVLASLALLAPLAAAQQPAPAAPAANGCIPASPKANDVVQCVQTTYNASQTFSSPFQQRFWVKAYNQEKASAGTVVFSKPGKMSWTYTDDQSKGNRVVSDGTTIKVYEKNNNQMFQQPLDKSQYPAALSFLTGTGKLADSFDFELFSGDSMKFPGGQVLVGTPKQATPAYAKVLFYVDQGTSQVRRVMIIDGQGNRNRFDFDSPTINGPVTPDAFTFTPPPGTSIIHP